jgi:multidrug efflux pump subunit AcrA (membrane-fusion protein)
MNGPLLGRRYPESLRRMSMCEGKQLLSAALIVAALLGTAPIQTGAAEPSSKEPVLHTVKQGPIKITADLEGVIVAETMHEIRVEPRSWDNFTVSEAVSYGSQVRKGDVLIRFNAQELEDTIADLEAEEKLADLAIEQLEQELPQHERSLNLELEAAERETRIAKQHTERFAKVERPVEEESSEWIMKSAQFSYESSLEELQQLQKMYEADDVTEETEEFILKRQRHSVEQAKFRLKTAELDRDRKKQLSIPRQGETYQHAREMSELTLAKAKNDVQAEVPQVHLPDLQVGTHAPVSVPATGAEEIRGRLADVAPIPMSSGKFAARVTLQAEQGGRSPVPGMTCRVHPVVYAKQDALLVPTSAVGEDKWTGGHYVMYVEGDQPPKKRMVRTGRKSDDSMEILEGLSAGDRILKNVKEGRSS